MENFVSRGKEPGSTGRYGMNDLTSGNTPKTRILEAVFTGDLLPDARKEFGGSSSGDPQKLRVEHDDLELQLDKNFEERIHLDLDLLQKSCAEERCKKNSRKPPKPPKPPRPPKGPSLSANDQKLVKEIAELALRKRERIERMKTLRKIKAEKPYSSCNSLVAMIITVLFFIIVIFQGFFFSRNSPIVGSDGSPAPSIATNEGLISVQFFNEFAPREKTDPSPAVSYSQHSPSEKPLSGADTE